MTNIRYYTIEKEQFDAERTIEMVVFRTIDEHVLKFINSEFVFHCDVVEIDPDFGRSTIDSFMIIAKNAVDAKICALWRTKEIESDCVLNSCDYIFEVTQ